MSTAAEAAAGGGAEAGGRAEGERLRAASPAPVRAAAAGGRLGRRVRVPAERKGGGGGGFAGEGSGAVPVGGAPSRRSVQVTCAYPLPVRDPQRPRPGSAALRGRYRSAGRRGRREKGPGEVSAAGRGLWERGGGAAAEGAAGDVGSPRPTVPPGVGVTVGKSGMIRLCLPALAASLPFDRPALAFVNVGH